MTTKDEAMKLALEALERMKRYGNTFGYRSHEQNPYEQVCEAITALKALADQPAQQEPINKYCCHLCFNKSGHIFLDRMILCPECGNKRCPKATHHELPCTNSNEPGQQVSMYTSPPAQRIWIGLVWGELPEDGHDHDFLRGATWAEAKLKEKNT